MASLFLLIPLAIIIIYYDVRYRRIPNAYVLAALISGLTINTSLWRFSGRSQQSWRMRAGVRLDVHAAHFRSDGRRRREAICSASEQLPVHSSYCPLSVVWSYRRFVGSVFGHPGRRP